MNWSAGKCDLTDEQADEQERRREIYNRACDEETERRRKERENRWRNTPLDPAVEEALHGTPPEVAWEYLQCVLFDAFDAYPEQAEQLREYQPPYDEEGLNLTLQNLNPKVGLSNFLGCGEVTDLSDLIHKADPLKCRAGALDGHPQRRMEQVTSSHRRQLLNRLSIRNPQAREKHAAPQLWFLDGRKRAAVHSLRLGAETPKPCSTYLQAGSEYSERVGARDDHLVTVGSGTPGFGSAGMQKLRRTLGTRSLLVPSSKTDKQTKVSFLHSCKGSTPAG